ncbi:MAG: putative porin, partial [Kiritimatiellaeota bacterium]|nr:putative porin [Kiritimatiellota bacterium]
VAGLQVTQGEDAKWYDSLKLSGDMRYRFDNIQREGQPNRERDRIRARLGLKTDINEDFTVGIRLGSAMAVSTTAEEGAPYGAPGEGAPFSENQTLTDQNSQKAAYFDLAYIDFHPSAVPGLDLIGGKMPNPFITVDTYLWDPDLAPEGLAAKYRVGDEVQLLANASYFWLKERRTDDDTKLYAGQLAVNFKLNEDSHVMAGGSYYGFQKMEGFQVLDWQNNNNGWGNTTTKQISGSKTNALYAEEFKVVEGFVEAGTKIVVPVSAFGAYTRNLDPDSNNKAWTLGVLLGKAKDPGTFQVGYDYRHLEKDAWPGALPDDDAWGGGTDGKGHKFTVVYQLMKNLQLCGTCWISEKNIAPGETSLGYKEFLLDVVAKF